MRTSTDSARAKACLSALPKGRPGFLAAAVLLFTSLLVCLGFGGRAVAGQPIVLPATGSVDGFVVGGARVYWAYADGAGAAVYSSSLARDRRLVWRAPTVDDGWYRDFDIPLHASSVRVVAQLKGYWDDEPNGVSWVEILSTVSATTWSGRLWPVKQTRAGYEEVEDVDGDAVLSSIERGPSERRTLQFYVRDFARTGAPQRPVGPRIALRVDEDKQEREIVDARIAGPWVAVLRRGWQPTITVYDWHTSRAAWTASLPARPGSSSTDLDYWRSVNWDLAADGTMAVALAMNPRRASRVRATLG